MALTLIGYRGSGKSAVGRAVAARLGRPFADADEEVERRAGRTIRKIFETLGEPHFRKIEREVMAELLASEELVIAAGGGAVLSAETRDRLRRSGPVVYLHVTPAVAERRIAQCASTAERRPALTHLPPREEIESVLAAREPLYLECATIPLDADDSSVDELVDAIVAALSGGGGAGT